MVKHVHATLDDDEFEQVRSVVDSQGYTWGEFLIKSAQMMEEEQ